jgi:transcriptional regulator with XRE-family HTH domain
MNEANSKPEITPEEVRAIRESLGLTQVEAGELLGGGPRAFTKYESGTTRPAAAVINLLRLLQANPSMIKTLSGSKTIPISNTMVRTFEVSGKHIEALTERTFTVMLRKLLNAEAQANELPADRMHVASNITTPDAGEDGRFTWIGGPERTPYLPGRFCQFQLKAGKITPGKAAAEVLTKTGEVKEMVRDALEKGGFYIMMCGSSYVAKDILARENYIRKAIRAAGLTIADEQIAFRDADQIADWANRHPTVATWILEKTQPGLIGPFRSWNHWSGRAEHDGLPWIEDSRILKLLPQLREVATSPKGVARVLGSSGIGKSRLVLESLGPTPEEEEIGQFLSDSILYTVESEVGSLAIKEVIQNLADSGGRVVVVVDQCLEQTHLDLERMVSRNNSKISLITIHDEMPIETPKQTTLKIDEAPITVIEGIINLLLPGLQSEDQRRLVHFSKGFPKIAILVSQAWKAAMPLAHATDDNLVNGVLLGNNPREPDLVLKSASLLAAFGLIKLKDDRQLVEIASLGRGLTDADLRFVIEELGRRGLVQHRGRTAILQPIPIALRLAERQWREWSTAQWDRVLVGETNSSLKIMAARRLALLNTTAIAQRVVQHVCRLGGSLNCLEGISQRPHSEILSTLAEIDTGTVLRLIENTLENVDLLAIDGNVRLYLILALEKIAFCRETFEDAARLLLQFAVNENEKWGNNATEQFKKLFPFLLGNTEAEPTSRLMILDEAMDTEQPQQRIIVVEALIAGSETGDFSRIVGSEIHGARPALQPWKPKTWGEAWDYVKDCTTRLATMAEYEDNAGTKARIGLGHNLRFLVIGGLIETVELVVRQVCTGRDIYWQEAAQSLRDFLSFDTKGHNFATIERVKTLIAELEPMSLEGRVCLLVTERLFAYPNDTELTYEEQDRQSVETVRNLAVELLAQPEILERLLPKLSKGQQRMATVFGRAIAELEDSPLKWLLPIKNALAECPDNELNYDLLIGYLAGISKIAPEVVEDFKQQAVTAPLFTPMLPLISWRLGINKSDIQLAIKAIQSGLLKPSQLMQWTMGGELAKLPAVTVAPFFDILFELNADTYAMGLDLLEMYCYKDADRLEGLRPQIRKIAANAAKWPLSNAFRMSNHRFEHIMSWLLKKGRNDADARAAALTIARGLEVSSEFQKEQFIKPILPLLLSDFPEIVWPLIGKAIVSDRRKAWHFEYLLGGRSSLWNEQNPAILSLPEDTIFAWCHAHPEQAPAFVAAVIPFLTTFIVDAPDRQIHAVAKRLLEEFGEREEVLQCFSLKIGTYSWTGSLTTYYALYKEPLQTLLNHKILKVRNWAKRMLNQINTDIESAHNDDEEQNAYWEL